MSRRARSTLFLFSILAIFSCALNAQKSSISGTVIGKDETPLLGALVVLQDTNFGAVVDEFGRFVIAEIPFGNYRLHISALGFKPVIRNVSVISSKEIVLNVIMEDSAEQLDEVTVVVKSKTEKIREQGYAVAVINTIAQKNLPTDVNQLLKASPGVNIRESGGLGSGFTLSLNGLSGNQIRYFIDGVPMENFGSSLTLNNFPANLIERIEVYKGVVPVSLGADALGGAVNVRTGYRKKSFLDASFRRGLSILKERP